MAYSTERLEQIFDRTSGYCHICSGKLSFCNYARHGARGAWEVEHSIPKCEGGTDHLNNLYAAHISCNREKQAICTRKARARNGRTKAPLSSRRRAEAKSRNAITGGLVGGLLGSIINPWAAVAGAVIGGKKGYDRNPDY
ncbi:MAG: 5-methylcytosine-specific restriction enzyme [Acidobacteriota bacterium]|jgi:5-methylcytosine-specific restriction endonuclease McrA|nr:5-methylcytosine-specific restriction enzyme [Acidobacteriota bacterium]